MPSGSDTFIARYEAASGDCLHVSYYEARTSLWGTHVAVDPAGNIYVAGEFGGSVDFGGGVLEASQSDGGTSSGGDSFVVKLGP